MRWKNVFPGALRVGSGCKGQGFGHGAGQGRQELVPVCCRLQPKQCVMLGTGKKYAELLEQNPFC